MYNIEKFVDIEKGRIASNYFPELKDGRYLLSLIAQREPKNIDEYRAEYFAKRDILASHTGYSKKIMHHEIKQILLCGASTTYLDTGGWEQFIFRLKEWALETFECYL